MPRETHARTPGSAARARSAARCACNGRDAAPRLAAVQASPLLGFIRR
jgi:hypothetical protein